MPESEFPLTHVSSLSANFTEWSNTQTIPQQIAVDIDLRPNPLFYTKRFPKIFWKKASNCFFLMCLIALIPIVEMIVLFFHFLLITSQCIFLT